MVKQEGNLRKCHLRLNWSSFRSLFLRGKKVKRAVLSRAANLRFYLLDKSIAVSESRAECAGRELEGLSLASCPPGPSWGATCLFLHPLSLLLHCTYPAHTKKTHMQQAHFFSWNSHAVTSCWNIYTIECNKESTMLQLLECRYRLKCIGSARTQKDIFSVCLYTDMCEMHVYTPFVPWHFAAHQPDVVRVQMAPRCSGLLHKRTEKAA